MNIYCIHEDREIYQIRKQSIIQQCENLSGNYQLIWVSDFPASFFSAEENAHSPYVRYDLQTSLGAKSCFYKHYAAFKQIAASGEMALVIEDDAIFDAQLIKNCQQLLQHFSLQDNCYINIEYTADDLPLWYWRYPLVEMKGTKLTGGYLISPAAAKKCYQYIDQQLQSDKGISLPADAFISIHYAEIGIHTYWSNQALIFQGSQSGTFASDLSHNHSLIKQNTMNLFLRKRILPFINKLRACFRRKIKARVIQAFPKK